MNVWGHVVSLLSFAIRIIHPIPPPVTQWSIQRWSDWFQIDVGSVRTPSSRPTPASTQPRSHRGVSSRKQTACHTQARTHTHTQKPPITSKHIIYWGCLATKRRHTHHNIMANLYPAVSATGRQTWRAISLALVSGAKKSPSNKKLVLIYCKQKAIDWNQCIKV